MNKLMYKGNPKSADATIARDTNEREIKDMKKAIYKIRQFIMANRIIFILLVTYIAFHAFFEKHITNLLVNTFFCYLDSTWYNDLFFIISCILICILFKKSEKLNSHISNQIFIISILCCLIIGYYRCFSDIWIFTSMLLFRKIKYIDLVFILCLSNIILYILYFLKKKDSSYDDIKDGFSYDTPIKTGEEDKLNRKKLAETLAQRIVNTTNNDAAFAIGICSEWGHGKTSFLKLIESNIRNKHSKNRIIIQFNPWLNNDECSIINTFFDELSKELKPYNKELSQELIEYAKILNTADNTFIDKLSNVFKTNHSNNLSSKFKTINDKIRKSGKQIIIFVDDLDRLYEKEIIEVLRLIRNSANFTNTVFIVAYDKNYLVSAIKKIINYRPDFYLEKIFQLEVALPNFEKYIIAQKLKETIEPFLLEDDKAILKELLGNDNFKSKFNYSMFANFRDINRFVNSFQFSYEALKGEIVLLDLLNLELLRAKYLGVYVLLSKDYYKFLDGYEVLRLKKSGSSDNAEDIIQDNNDNTLIKEYLETHYNQVGIQKEQIKDIMKYVTNVFSTNFYDINLLSITNIKAIDRYFHYNLLQSNLSNKEFLEYAQEKPIEKFKSKISEWVQQGFWQDVFDRLKIIEYLTPYKNKKDYENIIDVIFFFASIPTPDNKTLGFDFNNLKLKLKYETIKNIYSEEEFKKFVINLFSRQEPPYLFISEFINSIFNDTTFDWNFVLSKDELKTQKINYFKQYVEQTTIIDKHFFWLYGACGYIEWVESGRNARSQRQQPPSEEAKQIFKDCAKRLTNDFLRNIITTNRRLQKTNEESFSISPTITNVWGCWKDFEDFLVELDEQQVPSLKEFKDFFAKCKEVNFEKYIKYNFKDIDLSNALLFDH